MVLIVDGELPVDEIVRSVQEQQGGATGAIVTFLGTVRNHSQGHGIEYLEYEAYRPMAQREMERIVREVWDQWGFPCAIAHRLGRLYVGEASVVVAVASSHRKEAFLACHYAIDRLKETVPIWKKEVATDGYWWVEDPLRATAGNA
jgi:molybdopterin synthase catalytic subunit